MLGQDMSGYIMLRHVNSG